MHAARKKMSREWHNIGRHAAQRGMLLADVLTKSDSVNELIQAGYAEEERRMARLARSLTCPDCGVPYRKCGHLDGNDGEKVLVYRQKQYRDLARELVSMVGGRPAEEQVADMAHAARLVPDELMDVVDRLCKERGL